MSRAYDVAIIGAGPVGCVTALAFAREGASVLLLEANPRASQRLAGEWLHPPAVEVLRGLDAYPEGITHPVGQGFAVFPDDGSEPMVLPYGKESHALSIEHAALVEALRARCEDDQGIDYRPNTRAVGLESGRVTMQPRGGAERSVPVQQVVGAGGRSTVAHAALGIDHAASTYSRMAGLLLENATLPFEGHGHVFLGGPGPVLAYRLDERYIRVCLDIPLSMTVSRNREATLWEGYRAALPSALHTSFRNALHRGDIGWAANQTRPRVAFGREGLALVGDSVGHHHPLTAIGMTLGFQDGQTLARSKNFRAYERDRRLASRVPEMLAVALYEVFADTSDELVAIRSAVYDMWRRDADERSRTMAYLACQNTSPREFAGSFLRAVMLAGRELARDAVHTGRWRHTAGIATELADRCRWLVSGALRFTEPRPSEGFVRTADSTYGAALKASSAKAEVLEHPAAAAEAERRASKPAVPHIALERAVRALKRQQNEEGAWEGECIWCPMLPAQYVIMCHLTRSPISAERRRRVLLQFERTQLPDGTWSLSEGAPSYLFTTTLVYVAARMLGVAAEDPLLRGARAFIEREQGVVAIPSWGKFWLALCGLYEWDGVNPVLPEIWRLPRSMPIHPGNYYCHTRLIYLGLASLYGERFELPDPDLIEHLRQELYPDGYAQTDWPRARHLLREAEIIAPPNVLLRVAYDALRQLNRHVIDAASRTRLRAELREHIRFELRASDYTCISPVSGLLNLLTLWHHDPADPDFARQLARLEGWFWEDDVDGSRITGARSASWDTAFAVQALTAASPHFDVTAALERADAFLDSQQIRTPAVDIDYRRYYRIDPRGGWTFAGIWHGWPVSDCTAEAMCARIESPVGLPTEEAMTEAARFILRTQNDDGGFGTYEPKKSRVPLEWLNPAEMFGDSMTEHSCIECTASCIAALTTFRQRYPEALAGDVERAVERAARRLRWAQHPDGTWTASWGVHFTYSIMFGIRGLVSAGASLLDPAIRKACRWLKQHQRPDGGWGESYLSGIEHRYVPARESQVIQTAWALTALLEAHDPDWDVIERAAHFLAHRQRDDGTWPRQQPSGIFFHTALLHYEMYRSIFPLWALGLYETRRLERLALVSTHPRAQDVPAPHPAG